MTEIDMPALALRDVEKIYGRGADRKHAVSGVTLSVRHGEVYGFLGPNGAGKSTTIRMILGLIRASGGHIHLLGRPVADPLALRRVGSLVDGGAFYPFLSGRQNLRVLARTQGHEGERIEMLLELVGLSRDAKRKVAGYSLGMKQRLGVAAALLNDPDLVILDEPSNGLDASGIQEMRHLVRDLADQGKAVFLSSHLLHEVEQLCDRVAIVANGKLLREASVREMLAEDAALLIEAEPVNIALQALEADWQVAKVESALHVRARRDEVPAIMRRLHEARVDIFRVAPDEESLENIFLTMTRTGNA